MRGWSTHVASSAEAALELFGRDRCDLVICDINLGDMDGLSVARTMLERAPAIKIIIVSALPEIMESARLEGFTRRLRKPFDPAQLYAFLDENISAAGQH
jgi:two-component system response regulator FlrC